MVAILLFLAIFASSVQAANIPTITVTNRATVRFPVDTEKPKPRTTTERFLVSTQPLPTSILTTTASWSTTIHPTSTTQRSSVQSSSSSTTQIPSVFNHSKPFQNEDGVEEIIEILNFLRQLPQEKLAELFGKKEPLSQSPTISTTESALVLLNNLREQKKTTAKTTSTTSSVDLPVEDELAEAQTKSPIIFEEQVTTLISTDIDIDDLEANLTIVENELELLDKSALPGPIAIPEVKKTSTTTLRPNYEFTDYPPPLPPPLNPTEFEKNKSAGGGGNTDTSFAVGVAVGILACVVVASTGVTWCVCKRHWGRRNVYATMEADEIPSAFTKPGPPVILPSEFRQGTCVIGRSGKCNTNSDLVDQMSNHVTEL